VRNGYCRNGHRIGVYYESDADYFQVMPPVSPLARIGLDGSGINSESIEMITYRKVWRAKDHQRWYEWEA